MPIYSTIGLSNIVMYSVMRTKLITNTFLFLKQNVVQCVIGCYRVFLRKCNSSCVVD